MSDSSIPSPAPLPAAVSDETSIDKVFLALAVGTLLLAGLLRNQGPQQVVVPWLNLTLPETCSLRRWTGVDCAGCGLTRSFIRLAHGDLVGAWSFHPLGPALFAFVAAQIPYRLWQLWRCRAGKGRWYGGYWVHMPLIIILVLMLTRWVMRLYLMTA